MSVECVIGRGEAFPLELIKFPKQAGVVTVSGRENRPVSLSHDRLLGKRSERISGWLVNTSVETRPGDKSIALDFILDLQAGQNQVITSGWHSWSGSVFFSWQDRSIGMRPFEKTLGGKTSPFLEPGPAKRIPAGEGRSYGWVCFRNAANGENLVVGAIPGFDAIETIQYHQEKGKIVVTVVKDLEESASLGSRDIKVFIGRSNAREQRGNYADLVLEFGKELARLKGPIPLMRNRRIGFSWAAHGLGINQRIIKQEIDAANGLIDTYIIDDGWETASGSLEIDSQKFPDLARLAQEMSAQGISPGIWTAPFLIKEEAAGNLPEDWFMKDGRGRRLRAPTFMGQSSDKPWFPFQRPYALDVSIPQFRKYLIEKYVDLTGKGFEVFKVDFLAVPFIGKLQNRDKTSVEYYREFFLELREAVSKRTGKEIELIGCGAPMMESIGLFNGIRMTPDSSIPNLRRTQRWGPLITRFYQFGPAADRLSRFNTGWYQNALAVAARRTLAFKGAHGLILDGVHLVDPEIPLERTFPFDTKGRERFSGAIKAFGMVGLNNLFVGDSLSRLDRQGRARWEEFIMQFKEAEEREDLKI